MARCLDLVKGPEKLPYPGRYLRRPPAPSDTKETD